VQSIVVGPLHAAAAGFGGFGVSQQSKAGRVSVP